MTSTPTWRQSRAALTVSVISRIALGAGALLLAASVLPVLVGWQSAVVMSGSMEPTLSTGDVAVVRPVDVEALEPGAVLLVDDPDAPGGLRLHRLVSVEPGGLQLKGDANPAADGTLVAPAAVHGEVTLGLPLIGEPAVWFAAHRAWPLVGTALGLVALLALAAVHRRPEDDPPADPPSLPSPSSQPSVAGRTSARPTAWRVRRGAVLTAAVLVAVALPGAAARFTDVAPTPQLTLPVARYWTCPEAVSAAGATDYFRLQEQGVANTGSPAPASGGGYSGAGVSYGAAGPACGAGENRAVALDGATGQLWSTQPVAGPDTFTVQVWFATTTTTGGKLVGFGSGSGGARSNSYDRHIYMLNSGQLSFGVYDGANRVVTTPNRYNDGAWHLAAGTFSPTTGLALYVDGQRLAANAAVTKAEASTGYWRMGYDNLNLWPGAPTSYWYRGSLAHMAVFGRVLSATELADQYNAGS
jgi:signal peptidase I